MSASSIAGDVESIRVAMREVGVTKVEPLGRQPLIVLEVNALQLEALRRTGRVEAVQKDVLSRFIRRTQESGGFASR
jgi:hypothetical protein